MKSLFMISMLILVLRFKQTTSQRFCNEDEPVITSVFSFKHLIFLVRDQNVWHYNTKNDMIGELPISLNALFPGLSIENLSAGFTVESIPQCDGNSEKCKFNSYMSGKTFIFYYKQNGKPQQIYSMVKFKEQKFSFQFDYNFGGLAYELRANRSFKMSTWPGAAKRHEIKTSGYSGAAFDSNTNEIVLFGQLNERNDLPFFVRSLSIEWSNSSYHSRFLSEFKLFGVFRMKRKLYAVFVRSQNRSQYIMEYVRNTTGNPFIDINTKVGQFFKCSKATTTTSDYDDE